MTAPTAASCGRWNLWVAPAREAPGPQRWWPRYSTPRSPHRPRCGRTGRGPPGLWTVLPAVRFFLSLIAPCPRGFLVLKELRMRSARRPCLYRRPFCWVGLERLETRDVPSFLTPRAFDVGNLPISVAVGEFNGDGLPDLVTANA